MWRIQSLPCKKRETCFGRAIWPIVCADKIVDENTCTFDRWSCARRSIAKVPRTSGQATTQNRVIKFGTGADYWQRLMSDSTSWQKTLTSSDNLQRQWHVVSILYHEMKNHLTRKVGFEGTPKFGLVLEVTTSYLQVNMEWKLELNL